MQVEPKIIKSVMKALYNMADEDNYSVYDTYDIAEYLGLNQDIVDAVIELLEEAKLISECMNLHDDGVQTYALNDKGIDLVEQG